NVPRTGSTAVLLPDDKRILASGGVDQRDLLTKTAEIYDIATGRWSLVASMQNARSGSTGWSAIVLKNGNVLVAGGDDQQTSEIYVPDTDTWSSLHHIEQTVQHDYQALYPSG